MANDRLLIRGGTVIDTEPAPVVHRATDVLVVDGRIAAVGNALPAAGAEVIDAADRIVLPGFVDTHRHMWQGGLRSLVINADNLGPYFDMVYRRIAPRMRAEDMHIGTLAGALECLDAGITTVQDYSLLYTVEHGEAVIEAHRAAGIRTVYGPGSSALDPDSRRPDDIRRIRRQRLGSDDDLVTMTLAPAGPAFAPIEEVEEDWKLADELGLPIAVHIASGPVAERPIEALRQRGLLRPNTLYVHGNSLPDDELRLIADSGASMSITPTVEAHLNLGPPLAGRVRAIGLTTGLGIDVVTTSGGDMFSQMRAALLTSQLGELPRVTAADVLRMATLDGARALGLDDRIGSLRPGKQADLLLLRADAPNLVATHDEIGAVVTAAHPGNVDTVLVAGRAVKRDGRLLHPVPADDVRKSAEYLVSG